MVNNKYLGYLTQLLTCLANTFGIMLRLIWHQIFQYWIFIQVLIQKQNKNNNNDKTTGPPPLQKKNPKNYIYRFKNLYNIYVAQQAWAKWISVAFNNHFQYKYVLFLKGTVTIGAVFFFYSFIFSLYLWDLQIECYNYSMS